MRNEISFDPRCSTSGYNFVLARVVEGIALRLPAKALGVWSRRRCVALQSAYMRVAMLDMSYVVDVYMRGALTERQRTLSRLGESFETAVAGIASGVAAAAENLRNTADALTHSADSTNLQSMAAVTASKEAAASVTSNIVGVTETAANSNAAAKELLKSATDLTRQSEVLSKQVEDFPRTVRAA